MSRGVEWFEQCSFLCPLFRVPGSTRFALARALQAPARAASNGDTMGAVCLVVIWFFIVGPRRLSAPVRRRMNRRPHGELRQSRLSATCKRPSPLVALPEGHGPNSESNHHGPHMRHSTAVRVCDIEGGWKGLRLPLKRAVPHKARAFSAAEGPPLQVGPAGWQRPPPAEQRNPRN